MLFNVKHILNLKVVSAGGHSKSTFIEDVRALDVRA